MNWTAVTLPLQVFYLVLLFFFVRDSSVNWPYLVLSGTAFFRFSMGSDLHGVSLPTRFFHTLVDSHGELTL